MNLNFRNFMRNATRLTRTGNLQAATVAIQAALRSAQSAAASAASQAQPDVNSDVVVDVEAREVDTTSAPARDAVHARAPIDAPAAFHTPAEVDASPVAAPAPAPAPSAPRFEGEGRFIDGTSGAHAYKLYIPPQAASGDKLPLVVMLHGCTQNPDDFAAGTQMNEAARERGCFVLYPAQSQQANPQRCWNWFKHTHQTRGRGEPAMLAAMTREAMASHPIDPSRVYVAGLSAGGAMAAIVGDAYPDLFAAVGVHSGLAAGSAKDLPSALGAMRSGSAAPARATSEPARPTIVFHGDADSTVHPSNGDHVIAASAASPLAPESNQHAGTEGRAYTRNVHRGADGRVAAEHWIVHGSGHAWSGGSQAGSYTDPQGPNASVEMLRFFLEHPRA